MLDSVSRSTVIVPVFNVELVGEIALPAEASSIVIFAHGSGSSRLSPRNQMVSDYLNKKGIGTFLFDLLTYDEDKEYTNRFNINLLAERLKGVTTWLLKKEEFTHLPIGYFGASTGAAAALVASVDMPQVIAIVSRGGRPDLAMRIMNKVKAPVLLIIGSYDREVLNLNVEAYNGLKSDKKLEIIPGATHLFPETGAMEKVCELASEWFQFHLHQLELH